MEDLAKKPVKSGFFGLFREMISWFERPIFSASKQGMRVTKIPTRPASDPAYQPDRKRFFLLFLLFFCDEGAEGRFFLQTITWSEGRQEGSPAEHSERFSLSFWLQTMTRSWSLARSPHGA